MMRSIKGVSLRGIACSVPPQKIVNRSIFHETPQIKNIDTVGVEFRRVSEPNIQTSDLCIHAAKNLIESLGWTPTDIDILLFVTQTPDYQIPSTCPLIAQALGLRQDIVAFDVNQGCSGYVQGLDLISGLMTAYGLKKALLLVGDTISKVISQDDIPNTILFGDAGTASALEINDSSAPMNFTSWVNGSGSKDIIVKNFGTSGRFCLTELGVSENYLSLNGINVFSFAISKVPSLVKKFCEDLAEKYQKADFLLVLHQANLMINATIEKKLGITETNSARSIHEFGNTSSASIPLSLCFDKEKAIRNNRWLLVGFGVGLNINCCHLHAKDVSLNIYDYAGI